MTTSESSSPMRGGPQRSTYELGPRPALQVQDLPTPEAVFSVDKLGRREILRFALGPSLIALGVSIGGGEWILGPLAIGAGSFKGILFAVTLSALFQTIYNIEISRYVLATGEVPIVGFGRVPPGYLLWVPAGLGVLFLGFVFGGTFAVAGQGLFPLLTGRVADGGDLEITRLLAIIVIVGAIVLTFFARKISAALERLNLIIVSVSLALLLALNVALVPADAWAEAVTALVTPVPPPAGTTATAIGSLVGYTALLSGLNWCIIVNGGRKLTPSRQSKSDPLGYWFSSLTAAGTRPSSRFFSR